MIATATPADLRAAPDTAGRPADGTEVRILDADHREVPAGEVGQIFVRSSTLFDGYTSGATKDFHDGFMASGDMGYLDDAGRLFVVGRDDEMIVSGGENVYPIEVEKTLVAHPDGGRGGVLGVDDEQYGQRLAAFVVPAAGRHYRHRRRPASSTCATTSRTTRCRATSRSSTSFRAAAPARSCATSCAAAEVDSAADVAGAIAVSTTWIGRGRPPPGESRRRRGTIASVASCEVVEGAVVGQHRDVQLVDVAPHRHVERRCPRTAPRSSRSR